MSGQSNLTFLFCAKSYLSTVFVHSTSAKLDPTTTHLDQKMCPSIVVRPRVERTTTGHSNHINGHSPRRFERKVEIDRIPMILSSDKKGNVEKQLSINSWKFRFLENSSTTPRTTSDTPHFSHPALFLAL